MKTLLSHTTTGKSRYCENVKRTVYGKSFALCSVFRPAEEIRWPSIVSTAVDLSQSAPPLHNKTLSCSSQTSHPIYILIHLPFPPLPLPLHYIPVWDCHKQLLTLMDTKIIKGETCVGACHNQSEELKSSWVMDHGLLFLHLVEVLPVPLKGEGWGSGRVGESWGRGQLERRYIGGFYKDTQAHGTG